MGVTIRRAGLADLTALVALERSFPGDRIGRREFHRLLTSARADVWVAADNTALLGDAVALYRRHALDARLYSLVVAPDARRRGVACALTRAVEDGAFARAMHRIRLEVRCDNVAAIRLYEKLGYLPIGRIPRFYEDGQDALRLERLLPENGSPNAPRDLAA